MKHAITSIATATLVVAFAAGSARAIDLGGALKSGTSAAKGMSLSDDDVRAAADQACAWSDEHNKVAPPSDKYAKRLAKLTAGLANGANRVAGLDFFVKDRAKAQEEALAQAVATARRQAEVAARAAGGQLGGLLEIIINDFERPDPRPMMAMAKMEMDAAGAPTEVSAGTSTVSVQVTTRWRYQNR